ncbi:hypothetical protein GGR50DRAFT_23841 [Xylaria sp. CBS 124048]|nr:hypothetical protein GGR50DRAFT_23841 [Xylaria sp. CBS 124048]
MRSQTMTIGTLSSPGRSFKPCFFVMHTTVFSVILALTFPTVRSRPYTIHHDLPGINPLSSFIPSPLPSTPQFPDVLLTRGYKHNSRYTLKREEECCSKPGHDRCTSSSLNRWWARVSIGILIEAHANFLNHNKTASRPTIQLEFTLRIE